MKDKVNGLFVAWIAEVGGGFGEREGLKYFRGYFFTKKRFDMRFTVIFFALFVFPTFSNAQSESAWNIDFDDRAVDIKVTSDGRILVTHGGQYDEKNGITLLNDDLAIDAVYDFNSYTNSYGASVTNVIETIDSGFVFSSVRFECDIVVDGIYKLNKKP